MRKTCDVIHLSDKRFEEELLRVLSENTIRNWGDLLEIGAVQTAINCLEEKPELKEPIPQIRFLIKRYVDDPLRLVVPLAYFKFCLQNKSLSEEDFKVKELLDYVAATAGFDFAIRVYQVYNAAKNDK